LAELQETRSEMTVRDGEQRGLLVEEVGRRAAVAGKGFACAQRGAADAIEEKDLPLFDLGKMKGWGCLASPVDVREA